VDRHQADAAGHVPDKAADQRGAGPASRSPAAADAAFGDEQREQRGQHTQVLTMQVTGFWRGFPNPNTSKQYPPPLLALIIFLDTFTLHLPGGSGSITKKLSTNGLYESYMDCIYRSTIICVCIFVNGQYADCV